MGQWVNTPMYRKVWQKIYAEYPKGFFERAWTVKADPDTVFLPERLSARLAAQPVPATGLYIEHCKEVDFGFFGSLEVMSKIAAKTLFENIEKCYLGELPWKTDQIAAKYGWYGEDLFAQKCMDLHGVKKIWQFDLITDGTCPLGRPWTKEKNEVGAGPRELQRARHLHWLQAPEEPEGILRVPQRRQGRQALRRVRNMTVNAAEWGPGVGSQCPFCILSGAPCRRPWCRNLSVALLPAAPAATRQR